MSEYIRRMKQSERDKKAKIQLKETSILTERVGEREGKNARETETKRQ
mgnify:CR=1 FL=1